MMNFSQIRDRKVIQIISTYAAVSWVVLQIIDQVVNRSILPELVYKISLTFVLALSPGVLIFAWFHGAKGAQKAPPVEKWLLSTVVLFSFVACFFVVRGHVRGLRGEVIEEITELEDPRRIAVLYFDARGDVGDAKIISNGVTEALIDDLSSIPELHIISQNGSELFRDSEKDLEEIGKFLKVGLLVNGSVHLSNEKVRIRLSLVEAATGRQIESTRIEQASFQLFDLIDVISNSVSNLLRKNIGEELNMLEIKRKTSDPDAWKLVQEASLIEKQAVKTASGENNDLLVYHCQVADSLLSLAQELDEQWPVPTIRRGWLAYRIAAVFHTDRVQVNNFVTRGMRFADKALDLAPENPDALELKATLLYYAWLLNIIEDRDMAFHEAEELFNQAIKNNPRQASALNSLSHLYLNKGWIPEAKQAAVTAYSIDPYLSEADRTLWRLTTISYDMGDTYETKRWSQEGVRRFPENYKFQKGMLLLNTMPGMVPDIDASWNHYRRCLELCPKYDSVLIAKNCLQIMAMILAKSGMIDSARVVSVRGKASAELDPMRDIAFYESIVHLWMDDPDEAIRLMGIYFSANPGVAEDYKEAYLTNDLYWYQQGLYHQDRFEALIGIR